MAPEKKDPTPAEERKAAADRKATEERKAGEKQKDQAARKAGEEKKVAEANLLSPFVTKVRIGEKYVVRQHRTVHYPPGIAGPYTGQVAKWLRAGECVTPKHPLEVDCLQTQCGKLKRVGAFGSEVRDASSREHHRQFQIAMRKYDRDLAGKDPETTAAIVAEGGEDALVDLEPAGKPEGTETSDGS